MVELRLPPGPLAVVALGAHSDDIEIGAAGLLGQVAELARYAPGISVDWIVASADGSRAREARASAERLVGQTTRLECHVWNFRERYLPHVPELKERMDELGTRIRPDLVICPRTEDRHQDHAVVADLAWQTFRGSLILEYDIPKWDGELGPANVFVILSDAEARRKVDHLMGAFPTQLGRSWFTRDTFEAVLRLRGIEAGAPSGYAEAYLARKVTLTLGANPPAATA